MRFCAQTLVNIEGFMRPLAQTLVKHIQNYTFWESEVAFICEKLRVLCDPVFKNL